MKKLQSIAFYALLTPAITFGAGSVLAQPSTGQGMDRQHQGYQRDQGATQSGQDRLGARDSSGEQSRGYLSSAPASGMQANNLIGAKVKTSGNEDMGSVKDLIINEDGQVVAIVVGVGGFLGMGERDIAIGWGHVTRSGTGDKQELHVDVSRNELQSAPEFKQRK